MQTHPSYINTTTINGNYGAETVLISNAADDDHTVNLNGDLTLLGNGKKLITVEGEGTPKLSMVNVSDGKALNLGSAAAPSQGGNLGADVELGDGSSLNAVAGNYTVGAVGGAFAGNGTVSSSAGGSLVAESIGANDNVAAVEASQGSIHSEGAINTGTLTIDGGVVSSAGTITATGDVKNTNGILTATTLKADAAVSVDGGILSLTDTAAASTVESLTLTNGTQADIAGSLTLGSGETLTVGTDDDTVGGTPCPPSTSTSTVACCWSTRPGAWLPATWLWKA